MFAFGMVALEIFTGDVPFVEKFVTNEDAMNCIREGCRPNRPNCAKVGLTDEMWNLLNLCWEKDGGKRKVIKDVVQTLRGLGGDDR